MYSPCYALARAIVRHLVICANSVIAVHPCQFVRRLRQTSERLGRTPHSQDWCQHLTQLPGYSDSGSDECSGRFQRRSPASGSRTPIPEHPEVNYSRIPRHGEAGLPLEVQGCERGADGGVLEGENRGSLQSKSLPWYADRHSLNSSQVMLAKRARRE